MGARGALRMLGEPLGSPACSDEHQSTQYGYKIVFRNTQLPCRMFDFCVQHKQILRCLIVTTNFVLLGNKEARCHSSASWALCLDFSFAGWAAEGRPSVYLHLHLCLCRAWWRAEGRSPSYLHLSLPFVVHSRWPWATMRQMLIGSFPLVYLYSYLFSFLCLPPFDISTSVSFACL